MIKRYCEISIVVEILKIVINLRVTLRQLQQVLRYPKLLIKTKEEYQFNLFLILAYIITFKCYCFVFKHRLFEIRIKIIVAPSYLIGTFLSRSSLII